MRSVKSLKKFFVVFSIAVVLGVFFIPSLPVYAAVPKKGNVAVVVDSAAEYQADPYHIASVEAMLIQELIMNGYKPVDEKKLAQIRRNKAAFFAAEDNVAAIRKLSSQYGISTVITVRVRVHQRKDKLVGYAARTSMAIMATSSGGTRLYGGTIYDQKPAYSPDEAVFKSIESAVRKVVGAMVR
jgi:hypothetical protein